MDRRARWARWAPRARVVGFAVAGTAIALALAGSVHTRVGPFDATLSARPALSGGTSVLLAPLGSIELDTHDAPLGLELRVDELQLADAERIARDPAELDTLEDDIATDARRALRQIALRCVLVAMVGGAVGAAAASARMRSLVAGAATGLVMAGTVGAMTVATFDADAVAEPTYSGVLSVAPTAVGDLEAVVDRFGEYRAQLSDLVGNVVTLYQAAQGLPVPELDDGTVRVLHVSDIHLNPQGFDLIDLMVDRFDIDAVADTGDTTDWGSEPEGQILARIGQVGVPYVWVRGNHDSGDIQAAVAAQPNAVVLDGDAATVAGLRFWGISDRRYTPDKDKPSGPDEERDAAEAAAPGIARALPRDEPPDIDVAMVHDPRMAGSLGGKVPLVLAGHTHNQRLRSLGQGTTLLVQGSTGGAGLRGLGGEDPEPLTCSVLYFDPQTGRLVALDQVTVDGLGESGARISRHVFPAAAGERG